MKITKKIPVTKGTAVLNCIYQADSQRGYRSYKHSSSDDFREQHTNSLNHLQEFQRGLMGNSEEFSDELRDWQKGTKTMKVFISFANNDSTRIQTLKNQSHYGLVIPKGFIKEFIWDYLTTNVTRTEHGRGRKQTEVINKDWESGMLHISDLLFAMNEMEWDFMEMEFCPKQTKALFGIHWGSGNLPPIVYTDATPMLSMRYDPDSFMSIVKSEYWDYLDAKTKDAWHLNKLAFRRTTILPSTIIKTELLLSVGRGGKQNA